MQQVLQFDPSDPEPYYNIGVVAAASGNAVKAMEFYKKAIELKLLEKYPKYKTDISELNEYCTE